MKNNQASPGEELIVIEKRFYLRIGEHPYPASDIGLVSVAEKETPKKSLALSILALLAVGFLLFWVCTQWIIGMYHDVIGRGRPIFSDGMIPTLICCSLLAWIYFSGAVHCFTGAKAETRWVVLVRVGYRTIKACECPSQIEAEEAAATIKKKIAEALSMGS